MLVLALDSSRQELSVAIYDSEQQTLLATWAAEVRSSQLMPALVDLFAQVGLKPQDLGLLACTTGPGLFTGIRTGLTLIKTLAAQLDLKILALNNFDLLRFDSGLQSSDPVILQAGKNDYFISRLVHNYFSFETEGLELHQFTKTSAELLIDYFRANPEIALLDYREVQAYYLREPSINKAKATI